MEKSTKIVCTIGPASDKYEVLEKMQKNGMNVVRLNFSHGNHDEYLNVIKRVRRLEKASGEPIAIIQDLQGPKIRVGELPTEGIELSSGQKIIFNYLIKECVGNQITIDYPLHNFVKKNERIFLNDGHIETKVISIQGSKIICKVKTGGLLTSHKGMNIPDTKLNLTSLTKKDREDVCFGIEQKVDFIALSFVNSSKDVKALSRLINKHQKKLKISKKNKIKIISKIERHEAVENIESIIDVSDAIMIARGDLGIEIPIQKVPMIQKKIIAQCIKKEKPVIVATQMLESMKYSPDPTRAEVSDVANAVIDSADAVMLSAETAIGHYPDLAVAVMSNIIEEAERSEYDNLPTKKYSNLSKDVDDIISGLSRMLAEGIEAKLILSASVSGDTGRLLSSYRPDTKIVILTRTEIVNRQLNLSWGVRPYKYGEFSSIEEMSKKSIELLHKKKILKKKDKIIIVAGEPIGEAGHINLLEVREV